MSLTTSHIRNLVLVGHGSCGKTSLAEAMLFMGGTTSRLGSVLEKTSVLDFEPEEQKRSGSIQTSMASILHDGHKINLLDTPGDQNFIYDSFNAMRGADAAIIVVGAADGVEVQTERVYHKARQLGLPVVFFVNKMDRDRADAQNCITEIEESFGVRPVPLQIPMGSESSFKGVVSLFQRKAMLYAEGGIGKYESAPVPAEYEDEVEGSWENLVEAVAETDDVLIEEYLENLELPDETVRSGFRAGLKQGKIVPVLYGSATSCIGAAALLDLSVWAFPSPEERPGMTLISGDDLDELDPGPGGDFYAQVFHTMVDGFSGKSSFLRIFSGLPPSDGTCFNATSGASERLGALFSLRGRERVSLPIVVSGDIVVAAKLKGTSTGDTLAAAETSARFEKTDYPSPMMSYIVRPASKSSSSKLKDALERILDEDPTLQVGTEDLTKNIVLHGMGQAHLDMAIERMRRKYKVEVTTDLPPVPYRETLKNGVHKIEGKHKKQTGGSGQFGVCFVNIIPSERGGGLTFVDNIVGGSIPKTLIPSVEKGIRSRMNNGFLAGYPIVDLEIELYDGKYHPVDSKDIAFQMAGSKALKLAFEKGGTMLLEPIYQLEIVVPEDSMGDIMGDLSSRRGRIMGSEMRGKNAVVRAHCPLAELRRYAPDLRRMTAGKGIFTMQFSEYRPVPSNLVSGIVASSPFKKDFEED
jgi:elongation factor G